MLALLAPGQAGAPPASVAEAVSTAEAAAQHIQRHAQVGGKIRADSQCQMLESRGFPAGVLRQPNEIMTAAGWSLCTRLKLRLCRAVSTAVMGKPGRGWAGGSFGAGRRQQPDTSRNGGSRCQQLPGPVA